MVKNKKDTIEDIFYQILKIKKLKNFNKLKIGQVSRWDSLNNLNSGLDICLGLQNGHFVPTFVLCLNSVLHS